MAAELKVREVVLGIPGYDTSTSWGARGQASDIRIQADEILYLKERLNTELSERTGKDYETIKEDTDRDFYMSPKKPLNMD